LRAKKNISRKDAKPQRTQNCFVFFAPLRLCERNFFRDYFFGTEMRMLR